MTGHRPFVGTLRIFSLTALFAGLCVFAAALFSCSNMSDQGYASGQDTVQAQNLAAGMGRICGTIDQDQAISKTVTPDPTSYAADSYKVYAWNGTTVQEDSPIYATVNDSARTFTIDLPFGSWTARVDGLKGATVVMRKQTAAPIVLNADNPVANLSFTLDTFQDASVPGSLELELNYDTSAGISMIKYVLTPLGGGSATEGSETANLMGNTTIIESLTPGEYSLVVDFLDADGGTVLRMDQIVQIYSNLTTNKINGNAPYIDSGTGKVNLTQAVIKKYQASVIYVGGTGASDTNNGTQYDPVSTLGRAISIVNSSLLTTSDAPDGFKIYVRDNAALGSNAILASGKKINIIGTNSGEYFKVSGAGTTSIQSAGDLTCSYINFDRLAGFTIDGGTAVFYSCLFTGGSAENGGGLCVSGPAIATLNYCTVSGCSAATNGGGVYANDDSASGTAQLTLNNSMIGAESEAAAQAAEGKHSNKAQSGGGVYVGANGSISFTGTNTISYNFADAYNYKGYGGGICAQVDTAFTNCKVLHNLAARGGGIYAGNGTFTMDASCEIEGNVANNEEKELGFGGAIYFSSDSKTFTMNGSKLCDNSAFCVKDPDSGCGGAVYIANGTFVMEDGEISGNNSYNGGAVSIPSTSGKFTMEDGKVSGNTATFGGAFYLSGTSAHIVVNGGEVFQNDASDLGDGFFNKGGMAEIDGGKVHDNDEIGLYLSDVGSAAWSKLNGGEISGHTECGVYICNRSGNSLEMTGGEIYDSKVGVHNEGIIGMTGGKIHDNTQYGVYHLGDYSNFKMSGDAWVDDTNYVYLAKQSSGTLSQMYVAAAFTTTTHPVATLWPEEYSAGTRVIQFASNVLATSECAKFAVKPDLDGAGWAVKQSAVYGNLATATVYVDGSVAEEGSGTKTSPCKTLANALTKVTMANSTIIVKNSTNETGDITIPNDAKYKGLTIKSAQGVDGLVINGSSYELTVRAGIKIENLSFNSWGGINIYATDKVTLNDVSVYFGQSFSGGALYLYSDAEVEASNLTISGCKATGTSATAGGIYVGSTAIFTVDGLTMTGCKADDTNSDGGGICNMGTAILKDASITGCTASNKGAAIYNGHGATLVLDGATKIDSEIYMAGSDGSAGPSYPIYIGSASFALAEGAGVIPLDVDVRTGTDEQFKEGEAIVQGDTGAGYDLTAEQCAAFAVPGTIYSVKYNSTTKTGNLIDSSISGGITVNIGANISFEIAVPKKAGDVAEFNVIDNSSGTPTIVTPASAQIKIMQFGGTVAQANAQEVTPSFTLPSGSYELYCKAVYKGLTYDTTKAFTIVAPTTGMVLIPAGTFRRAKDADVATNGDVYTVTLTKGFYMCDHEVTQKEFYDVMGVTQAQLIAAVSGEDKGSGDNYPVYYVNWYHAIAYCNKLSLKEGKTPCYEVTGVDFAALTFDQIPTSYDATWNAASCVWAADGYRLPTEAEWEYAALGDYKDIPNWNGYGDTSNSSAVVFAGYNGSDSIGDYAWHSGNASNKTHEVKKKSPNSHGLCDMSGNVREWCWDWYDSGQYATDGNKSDPRGASSCSYRVSRGGCWINDAGSCSVANRDYDDPNYRYVGLGFRVVRNAP
ncbi:MAG: SUMF1/EgtB/PvdO family nonheme iron enzyme [Treponema sp.]|nr:SUMF1/EgtB/PvdO family nonheme iron enzyme [Treponema sp.]